MIYKIVTSIFIRREKLKRINFPYSIDLSYSLAILANRFGIHSYFLLMSAYIM